MWGNHFMMTNLRWPRSAQQKTENKIRNPETKYQIRKHKPEKVGRVCKYYSQIAQDMIKIPWCFFYTLSDKCLVQLAIRISFFELYPSFTFDWIIVRVSDLLFCFAYKTNLCRLISLIAALFSVSLLKKFTTTYRTGK